MYVQYLFMPRNEEAVFDRKVTDFLANNKHFDAAKCLLSTVFNKNCWVVRSSAKNNICCELQKSLRCREVFVVSVEQLRGFTGYECSYVVFLL